MTSRMNANEARLARNTALAVCALVRAAAGGGGMDAADLRRSLLLDVVEGAGRRLLRPSADGCGRDPARHHDRRRHAVRRAAGLDPARAADELGGLPGGRDPVRWPAHRRERNHPAQRHADGRRRHADRDAGCAAAGRRPASCCSSLAKVLESGRGAWWLAVGASAGAALLSKYTALFFGPGDPDLACGGAEAAALVSLALALSRRPGRARRCSRRSSSGMPIINGCRSSSRWGAPGSRISGRPTSPS